MHKDKDLDRQVFTMRHLPELVLAGAEMHIICIQEPEKALSNWKANWRVYARQGSDEKLKVLVAYNSINPKDFKSTNGLFSFAKSIGLKTLRIPTELDQFEIYTKSDFDFSKATLSSEATK